MTHLSSILEFKYCKKCGYDIPNYSDSSRGIFLQICTQLLDRETRREKVIEAKNRELRLKMKTVRHDSDEHGDGTTGRSLADLKDPLILQCEQEYQAAIEAVINYFQIF